MSENKVIEMVIEAYIRVMGAAKWNALTAAEQHNVIMTLVKDCMKSLPC